MAISAPAATEETQNPSILAEKYDHVSADAAPADAPKQAASSQNIASKKSDDLSFGSFLFAVAICIALFQFGAGFISIDNKKEPGCFSSIGLLMLICGVLMALATIKSFWPILLLLGFCTLFSQSKPSSGGGCDCMTILLLLLCLAF
ncbi:MAG: hypothetical protein KKB51_20980 [Candidatus Riflebacteria bacterium]|nr:hypothetical protein [Candidatus Riflebacteria bacterium]